MFRNRVAPPSRKMFIPIVITRTSCVRHGVPRGIPCYLIPSASQKNRWFSGICNQRAHDAGFVGVPSKDALKKRGQEKS